MKFSKIAASALTAAAFVVTPAASAMADDAPQFTSAQASSGKSAYDRSCASCHGGSLEGTNDAPGLSGDFFLGYWKEKSVADLYDYMHDFMPPTAPSSLKEQEYVNIAAYVLSKNGVAAGDTSLDLEDDLSSMIIGSGLAE